MKRLALVPFCISLLALCTALADPVPVRFNADAAAPQTYQAAAYRGETLAVEARLTLRGAPLAVADGASATMHWQTNGMGAAWWTAPASVTTSGLVRARWTPAMDCGADAYRVFLGVADGGSNLNYRANMLLRMIGSPGESPNALPLPVQVLDFAKVSVTNAPWGESSGLTTNDVRAIVAADGYLPTNSPFGSTVGWLGSDFGRVLRVAEAMIESDGLGINGLGGESVLLANPHAEAKPTVYLPTSSGTLAREEDLAPYAQTASLGTAAYRNASDFATAADEQLVYQLLMGSNVVAEVTNYNSRVRAPQLRLLQLDPDTHEYITVWAETNGLARTLAEANAFTAATSNALDLAKADRAWSRTTSGLGADAPEGVTWISTPKTVISGGYEYERHVTTHGEVWVLTSNGMGFGGDTNSYFRVSTPDGETLFSIEKTDEQIVGVLTDGISVSGGVVTLNVGVVTYNGQAPICMASQSVSGPWSDLSEGRPAWISSVATNGVNGAWSFELESTSSAAFFYFLVRQPGATVIKNSAQTDLSGGILVEGTRFYPHKSGSTLTWTTTP